MKLAQILECLNNRHLWQQTKRLLNQSQSLARKLTGD